MKEHCHFPLVFIYMYLCMGDIFFSKPSQSSSRYFCKNKPMVLEYKEHACRSTCIMLMQIPEINRMPEIQRHLKYRSGRASCSYKDRNTKNILMGQCQQEIAAVHYFTVKRKKLKYEIFMETTFLQQGPREPSTMWRTRCDCLVFVNVSAHTVCTGQLHWSAVPQEALFLGWKLRQSYLCFV